MRVYKDYFWESGKLLKPRIDESKHLVWKFGGIPLIDGRVWDDYGDRTDTIFIKTNKNRSFSIKGSQFEELKKEVNLGYGKQYMVPKEYWTIQ